MLCKGLMPRDKRLRHHALFTSVVFCWSCPSSSESEGRRYTKSPRTRQMKPEPQQSGPGSQKHKAASKERSTHVGDLVASQCRPILKDLRKHSPRSRSKSRRRKSPRTRQMKPEPQQSAPGSQKHKAASTERSTHVGDLVASQCRPILKDLRKHSPRSRSKSRRSLSSQHVQHRLGPSTRKQPKPSQGTGAQGRPGHMERMGPASDPAA